VLHSGYAESGVLQSLLGLLGLLDLLRSHRSKGTPAPVLFFHQQAVLYALLHWILNNVNKWRHEQAVLNRLLHASLSLNRLSNLNKLTKQNNLKNRRDEQAVLNRLLHARLSLR
jgi:hypothetical protein